MVTFTRFFSLCLLLSIIIQLQAKRLLQQFACTADVNLCPDGSFVSRDASNNCAFPPCPKVAIDIIESVGCGIDYCQSYNDGCNDCYCDKNGFAQCTEKVCFSQSTAVCTGCEPGFILNSLTNKCEGCMCPMHYDPVCCNGKTYGNGCTAGCQQATGCIAGECERVKPLPSLCGGFKNCATFYDGCNNCFCGLNGMAACTKKMCFRKGPSRCIKCVDGYALIGDICAALY